MFYFQIYVVSIEGFKSYIISYAKLDDVSITNHH
jgi:hypothetical protein